MTFKVFLFESWPMIHGQLSISFVQTVWKMKILRALWPITYEWRVDSLDGTNGRFEESSLYGKLYHSRSLNISIHKALYCIDYTTWNCKYTDRFGCPCIRLTYLKYAPCTKNWFKMVENVKTKIILKLMVKVYIT